MSGWHRDNPDLVGTYDDPSVADGTNARTATLDHPRHPRLPITIERWRHTCAGCGRSYLEGSERPNGFCMWCGGETFLTEKAEPTRA